jgi:nucleotide-binding universal stress UspA family protein
MYHKILVPLDGSKRAARIIPHVEELAKRYKAKVIFLQVVEYKTVPTTEGAFISLSSQETSNAELT